MKGYDGIEGPRLKVWRGRRKVKKRLEEWLTTAIDYDRCSSMEVEKKCGWRVADGTERHYSESEAYQFRWVVVPCPCKWCLAPVFFSILRPEGGGEFSTWIHHSAGGSGTLSQSPIKERDAVFSCVNGLTGRKHRHRQAPILTMTGEQKEGQKEFDPPIPHSWTTEQKKEKTPPTVDPKKRAELELGHQILNSSSKSNFVQVCLLRRPLFCMLLVKSPWWW